MPARSAFFHSVALITRTLSTTPAQSSHGPFLLRQYLARLQDPDGPCMAGGPPRQGAGLSGCSLSGRSGHADPTACAWQARREKTVMAWNPQSCRPRGLDPPTDSSAEADQGRRPYPSLESFLLKLRNLNSRRRGPSENAKYGDLARSEQQDWGRKETRSPLAGGNSGVGTLNSECG